MICRFTSFVFAYLLASATASPFAPAQSKNNGEAAFKNNLLRKATPTANSQLRRLADAYEMDLTPYSVKFMQCQFVKAYDDDMADDEDAGTILSTERFVTFRLCPDSDCNSCNHGYGEYMVDLETYLQSTVEYYQNEQQEYCQACEECADQDAAADGDAAADDANADENGDEDNGGRRLAVDCDTCYSTCQFYENFEEQGYVDATEFLNCAQVDMGGNDDGNQYYVGPICAENGSEIKIGVFTDEFCTTFAKDGTDIDYLIQKVYGNENDANAAAPQLTYHTLGKVASGSCVSCLVENDDADANDAAEAQEMCGQLYEMAGKCETPYGFDGALSSGMDAYYNQVQQEDNMCSFIKAVNSGAYDEEGEIAISSSNVSRGSGSSQVTGWQWFLLILFVIGNMSLVAFAASLHSSLTSGSKADLSSKGGSIA